MKNITLLCVALLVILYAALSFNVSRLRLRKRKDASVSDSDLTKAIRAHGNASEYIPLFVAVLLYLSTVPTGPFFSWFALAIVVFRAMHAAGMFLIPTVNDRHILRFIGAAGTYFSLFALGILLFRHWLRSQ